MTDRAAKIEQVIRDLLAAFPLAFSTEPRQVKPLAIGIRQQIFTRCTLSRRSVADALWRYTNAPAYLRTITEGAVRVDLDGAASGSVTAMEAAHAARRIMPILAVAGGKPNDTTRPKHTIRPNTPANANIPPSPPNRNAAKPGPRRLGLADLKQAAAARRLQRDQARAGSDGTDDRRRVGPCGERNAAALCPNDDTPARLSMARPSPASQA